MMRLTLTRANIRSLTCPVGKQQMVVRDADCRGLSVVVRASGRKSFFFTFRDERNRKRIRKVADALTVAPEQARKICDRIRLDSLVGKNFFDEKTERAQVPTLNAFFYDTYLPFVRSYKKSWDTDLYLMRTHVLPVLGTSFIDEITPARIIHLVSSISENRSVATLARTMTTLRFIFNQAIKWKVPGAKANPTDSYQIPVPNRHRERYLSSDETTRLLHYVNRSANRMLRYIIPFLLLTGARRGEVLNCRWKDIDFERRFWRIPVTKSGRERHVPLSESALLLLQQVPKRVRSDYVFPNQRTGKPFGKVFGSFDTARRRAGLKDLRIHDLRHSFASFLVNAGCNIYEVQKILGHSNIKMTQRYSHLNQERLLQAVSLAEPYLESTMKKLTVLRPKIRRKPSEDKGTFPFEMLDSNPV